MPKKWGLGQFADLRGLGKKAGVVFLRGGVDTPMHTMKRDFSDIPDSELSLSKIKSYLKVL